METVLYKLKQGNFSTLLGQFKILRVKIAFSRPQHGDVTVHESTIVIKLSKEKAQEVLEGLSNSPDLNAMKLKFFGQFCRNNYENRVLWENLKENVSENLNEIVADAVSDLFSAFSDLF